jgi:hypothetical protein
VNSKKLAYDQILVTVLSMWNVRSDEMMGLSFVRVGQQ